MCKFSCLKNLACKFFDKSHVWLLHGFVKIDTKISLSCHMDLSKLLHGFALVVTRICLSCFMYFSPFAKKNQAEVLPRFQSLLKLLPWTKVLNALGLLCLWQCFMCKVRQLFVPVAFYDQTLFDWTKLLKVNLWLQI